MCIAYLAIDCHPDWPLFLAANRDEYHQRPALPAAHWLDNPDILGGRDVQEGGTWLGISRSGRFALVTNYREPGATDAGTGEYLSRGRLTSAFLAGSQSAMHYLADIAGQAQRYRGFNLIVGDGDTVAYLGNRGDAVVPRRLPAGRYTLSNRLLDTPWPKTERLRQGLADFPGPAPQHHLAQAFACLGDRRQAADADLPDTGLPLDRERLLSSVFIQDPHYGTRCSSVVAMHADGRMLFSEQQFDPQGAPTERHDWWLQRQASDLH